MKQLFVLVLVTISLHLGAIPVDSLEARQVAVKVFSQLHPEKSRVEIRETHLSWYRGVLTRYTFVFGNNDFVMIAADDAAVPVLAYSDQQTYTSEALSPEVAWWLESEYDQWIWGLQGLDAGAKVTHPLWALYREGKYLMKTEAGVLPLIHSKWGQSRTNDRQCPGFNSKVPDPNLNCGCTRCTAGCVAVAMAQVMNYWRFPESNGTRVFDWCHMPDELIKMDGPVVRTAFDAECNAIAGLMVNCGARAQVRYCSSDCATSSTIANAGSAIQSEYGYSSDMQHRYRTLTSGWKAKLKESLDRGMPVLYGGQSGHGGHAFVCDGYQNQDYFHFNWGWTGSYDGYYYIKSGDGSPEIDYDGLQEALFFIHPPSVPEANCIFCEETLVLDNYLAGTQYSPWFPNVIWHGLPVFYNYDASINPYIPAKATLVNGNDGIRLRYDEIRAGTIHFDQGMIPDHIDVELKAYHEIDLVNFETADGAVFTAEIVPCLPDGRQVAFDLGISVDPDNPTADEPSTDFRIFPNPGSGIFYITGLPEDLSVTCITLYGSDGQRVFETSPACGNNTCDPIRISVPHLLPGGYVVEICDQRGCTRQKLILAY